MWTVSNRPRCNCDNLRYPGDLTNKEWILVEPPIPPGKPGGASVPSTCAMLETG